MKNNEINKIKEQIRFGKGENNRNSSWQILKIVYLVWLLITIREERRQAVGADRESELHGDVMWTAGGRRWRMRSSLKAISWESHVRRLRHLGKKGSKKQRLRGTL